MASPLAYMIRPAVSADSKSRLALIRKAWLAAYGEMIPLNLLEDLFTGQIHQKEIFPGYALAEDLGSLVVLVENRLIATVSLAKTTTGTGVISTFAVEPEMQHQGIGMALWHCALATLRNAGCQHLRLHVLKGAAALDFYLKRGCTLGEDGYFRLGQHTFPAVCLWLKID
ncbi:MAG TPA: GNAT family N-acetyltransferase [Anaerolineaceae bacterium]